VLTLRHIARLFPSFILDHVEQKSGICVQIFDSTTQRLFWSQGLYRLFGLHKSAGEPSADLFDSLMHPADRARLPFGTLYYASKNGLPQNNEFRIVRSDRTVRWISCSTEALVDDLGEPSKLVSVFFDITEQKISSERVHRDELHRSAVMSMLNGISWIVGSDGIEQDVPLWQANTGQTVTTGEGRGWIEAVHPDDRDRVISIWRNAFQHREEYNARYRLRQSSGEYRSYIARIVPIFDRNGSISEWHGVCFDVEDLELSAPFPAPAIDRQVVKSPTGGHIRAARAAINWSVRDLANATNLTASVIRSIEEASPGSISPERLAIIVATLKFHGVEFGEQSDGRISIIFD
jgi:PAS domain-containing protein